MSVKLLGLLMPTTGPCFGFWLETDMEVFRNRAFGFALHCFRFGAGRLNRASGLRVYSNTYGGLMGR